MKKLLSTFPFHALCSISHTSGWDYHFRGLFSPHLLTSIQTPSCSWHLPLKLSTPTLSALSPPHFTFLPFLIWTTASQSLSQPLVLFPPFYLINCYHTILMTSHFYNKVHAKPFIIWPLLQPCFDVFAAPHMTCTSPKQTSIKRLLFILFHFSEHLSSWNVLLPSLPFWLVPTCQILPVL